MRKLYVLAAALSACAPKAKAPAGPTPAEVQAAKEDRGRYIMNTLGACTFCHTPLNPDGSRDQTRLFSGVDCLFDVAPMDPNTGCISSKNLTNHETGLANATDQQIMDAFRNGMGTNGKPLAPIMPYWIFHNIDDDDAEAMVAFLRTLPGVEHRPQAAQPPWADWPTPNTPITDAQIPMPRADYAFQTEAIAGRYLAAKAGLCIDCHTPDASMAMAPQLIDFTRPFAGARVFPAAALGLTFLAPDALVYSANLTSDTTGLAGWNIDQIIKAIKGGIDKDGHGVCAATHGAMTSTYAGLTDEDVTNIAHYISSLPPIANMRPMDCMAPVAR
jgi:cytochrome c553